MFREMTTFKCDNCGYKFAAMNVYHMIWKIIGEGE